MVDYSLCRPAPETKDVLSKEKETTGFAFTQNSRTFVPCLYLATRQMNFLNSTSSTWQRMWKLVAFFLSQPDKISSYPCDSAKQEVLITVVVPAGHEAVYSL